MVESQDMIVPMLREMREENAKLHEQTRAMLGAVDKRLVAVEEAQRTYRTAMAADTLLAKLVTGEFEERIGALERKIRELDASQ